MQNAIEKLVIGWDTIKQFGKAAVVKYRMIFCVAFFTGLLSYGFAMTNILNNYDNIACTPGGYGVGVHSGRWFLTVLGNQIKKIWGNYTLPLFNGILAILFISITVCVLISVLEIKSGTLACIAGMLFISFPTLAATMFFMYTVHYYAIAVFLIVLGVYFGHRDIRGGVVLAACCFALSMGIYQAYMPIAVSLYLLILLRKGFSSPELSGRKIFYVGIRYLVSLILGILLYYGILQMMLLHYDVTLGTYQGVDKMGAIKLSEIPEMLKTIYLKFLTLSTQPQYSVNLTMVTRIAFLFSQIISLMLFIYLECTKRVSIFVKIWNAVFFLLFPIGVNSIIVMCFHSNIYALMVYSIVLVFFQPMVLLESMGFHSALADGKRNLETFSVKCATAMTALVLAITSLNYVWQANGNYVALYYTNRQVENYFAEVWGKIRGVKGYNQRLPLAIVGNNFDVQYLDSEYERIAEFQFGGNAPAKVLINAYSKTDWMHLYFCVKQPLVSEEELQEIQAEQRVQDMPCYPDDGSIQIMDGVIVLKLERYR